MYRARTPESSAQLVGRATGSWLGEALRRRPSCASAQPSVRHTLMPPGRPPPAQGWHAACGRAAGGRRRAAASCGVPPGISPAGQPVASKLGSSPCVLRSHGQWAAAAAQRLGLRRPVTSVQKPVAYGRCGPSQARLLSWGASGAQEGYMHAEATPQARARAPGLSPSWRNGSRVARAARRPAWQLAPVAARRPGRIAGSGVLARHRLRSEGFQGLRRPQKSSGCKDRSIERPQRGTRSFPPRLRIYLALYGNEPGWKPRARLAVSGRAAPAKRTSTGQAAVYWAAALGSGSPASAAWRHRPGLAFRRRAGGA